MTRAPHIQAPTILYLQIRKKPSYLSNIGGRTPLILLYTVTSRTAIHNPSYNSDSLDEQAQHTCRKRMFSERDVQ